MYTLHTLEIDKNKKVETEKRVSRAVDGHTFEEGRLP
jgi:hypothetical protein